MWFSVGLLIYSGYLWYVLGLIIIQHSNLLIFFVCKFLILKLLNKYWVRIFFTECCGFFLLLHCGPQITEIMDKPKKVSEIRFYIKLLGQTIDNPFVKGWEYLVNRLSVKKKDGSVDVVDVLGTTQVALTPCSEYRDDFLNLSSGAKDLYWWMLMSVDAGTTVVYVNRQMFMNKTKPLKPDTFRRLVNELESKEMIIRVKNEYSEDVYMLNPRQAFRGSRITHFPKNKKYRE